MKNKTTNILIVVFLLCDILLFGFLTIEILSIKSHLYSSQRCKTISTNDGKIVLDIYDESIYLHHEPDYYRYTVDKNGEIYMSFSTHDYEVQIENNSIVLEYEHNHRLKFYIF